MRERRYTDAGDIRHRPPPSPPGSHGRDRDVEENWRFNSRPYRSPSPVRLVYDRSRQFGSISRSEQRYTSARTRSPPRPRSRDIEEIEGNRRFSGSNRMISGSGFETGRFLEMESVERDRYSELKKVSELSESSLSPGDSDFSRFRWENLLTEKPTSEIPEGVRNLHSCQFNGYGKDTCKSSGVFADSIVVNTSLSMASSGSKTYFGNPIEPRSSRNYGVINSDYVSPRESQLFTTTGVCTPNSRSVEFPYKSARIFHKRSSIVDIIDGEDIVPIDSMRERRVLDNHSSLQERYLGVGRSGTSYLTEQDRKDKEKLDYRSTYRQGYRMEGEDTRPRDSYLRESRILDNHSSLQKRYIEVDRKSHLMELDGEGEENLEENLDSGSIYCQKYRMEGEDDSHRDGSIREGGMLNNNSLFQEQYVELGRTSHLLKEDREEKILDSRSDLHLRYRIKVGLDSENQRVLEDVGFRRDGFGDSGSSTDGVKRLPVSSYQGIYESRSSPQRMLVAEELGVNDLSDTVVFNRKYNLDTRMSDGDGDEAWVDEDIQKGKIFSTWNGSDDIGDMSFADRELTDNNSREVSLLENSAFRHSQGTRTIPTIKGVASHGNDCYDPLSSEDLPASEQFHSSNHVKSSERDIKKRLGPVRSVKHRLGPAQNVKQRLGPLRNSGKRMKPVQKSHRTLPWIKICEERILEDLDGDLIVQEDEYLEVKFGKKKKKKHGKTEPPEDSDEFIQLVQSAFLKYVRALNENSAKRRKYMAQGGSGPLKCNICGSSKEFVDTLSLAQHAFKSCKVGFRSEHLGLHKALCVLMGWNTAKAPNAPWVWQILPDDKASSLKEDLIIWPPVVVIHNASIANDNPDERMIITIEELRAFLKGQGFRQGITNICRGKAANQSTMVVSFGGTLSGLRQAERLQKLFADNKHGRADFCNNSNGKTQRVPTDKIESVLYGYMGIADDLDKLDFETKKWCVVKSKEEIEAIEDALSR